jgi:cyanophycinase
MVCVLLLSNELLSQGSVLLVGGGSENALDWSDQPYRWLVDHAPNKKILILHYSTGSSWLETYFKSFGAVSATSYIIASTAAANDSAAYKTILTCDGLFLRGGDQAQYVGLWKGTLTQQAIKEVFGRGGVVGGTSAGEMVLSNVSYIAGNSDNGSLLRSPASSITLVDDFLPLVPDILAESHTNERGRLGRLPVFLARYKSSTGREITGVAVDANTAFAVGPDKVGEVMGGSAVALLRWTADTKCLVESGKPFSMQNMAFDQLLPGYKINLATGEMQLPATAAAFRPKQLSSPKGAIILDGSGKLTDWSASTGSLRKLQSALISPNDTIGIFSSPAGGAPAASVDSTLRSWGVVSRVLWIDETHKNDPDMTAAAASCGAFIFAGNSPDSLAGFLSPVTTVGALFASKTDAGKPILFLSEDVMIAGENGLGGVYTSAYGAYYGTLTQLPGLNLLKGMQPIPRFYQNQNNSIGYDYSENRVMGMLWSMGKSQLPYGILIDAGSYVTITSGRIEVGGISPTSTPVILIDARNAQSVDFPVFHRPGKPNPVQNAAFVGAVMHIIRPGDAFALTDVSRDWPPEMREFLLEQNYPNPFNPATTIRYSIPQTSMVSLRIYDLLGREVAMLVDQQVPDGVYETRWDASGGASGVYFVRLDQATKTSRRSQTKKLVFTK